MNTLLSICQMPGGVPIACVGIEPSRAKSGAVLAAQILGLKHDKIRQSLEQYRRNLAFS